MSLPSQCPIPPRRQGGGDGVPATSWSLLQECHEGFGSCSAALTWGTPGASSAPECPLQCEGCRSIPSTPWVEDQLQKLLQHPWNPPPAHAPFAAFPAEAHPDFTCRETEAQRGEEPRLLPFPAQQPPCCISCSIPESLSAGRGGEKQGIAWKWCGWEWG